jgi:RNA polymerase sigma-70 factor (ECF subfamily)
MPPYENLVIRSASQDEDDARLAFDRLARDFGASVHAQALGHLGDHHLAEDAAQSALTEAFLKLGQLQAPRAFPVWLKRIVRTQCERIRRRRRPALSLDAAIDIADPSPDPLASAETEDRDQILHEAIGHLPGREHEAIELFYFQDLSHDEVAKHLNIPAKTVKSRLFSARRRLEPTLRRHLSDRKPATFHAFPARPVSATVAQAA